MRIVLLLACALMVGCASYAAPGRAADMAAFGLTAQARQAMTDSSVSRAISKRPLAAFPTAIAVARVQAPGYKSETAEGWGNGRYSIVTTRDVEDPAHLQRLEKLPMIAGIAPVNRLLLPRELHSDLELRNAAAQLHADMLLIYTLDTTFHTNDLATPLSIVTLGLSPNIKTTVLTTASALLMDTRNGYLYGVAEATSRKTGLASAWTNRSAIDSSRQRTETEAFDKLVAELEQTWGGVVQRYGGAYQTNSTAN